MSLIEQLRSQNPRLVAQDRAELRHLEVRIDIFLAALSTLQIEILGFAVQGVKLVSIARRMELGSSVVNHHMTRIRQLFMTIVIGSDDPPEPPKPARCWSARRREKIEDRLRRDLYHLATGSSGMTSQTHPRERAVAPGRILFNRSMRTDELARAPLPLFLSLDRRLETCTAVISKWVHEPGVEVLTRCRSSGRLARKLRSQDSCILAYILLPLRSLPRI